jgi:cytidylate kinase
MSIVTISQALGSSGEAIARALAEELTYTLADREIILKAAECLGQGVAEFERLIESRPTLRERFRETRRDYLAAIEAVIWEFAAYDNVVLVGRGSTFVLQRIRHAFRLRVTAPLHVRARRLEVERGLVPDAEELVARSDRDWAARIRHLYDVALDDPLQYDLVLNTARLDVPASIATIRAALTAERFQATPASMADVRDRCMTARVHAALLCHPRTRELGRFFSCRDGQVSLSGRVTRDDQRRVAEDVVGSLPGVSGS